jgi:hypothetical protein
MSNINTLADRYFDIKAEIAGLTRLLDEVKTEIKAADIPAATIQSRVSVAFSHQGKAPKPIASHIKTFEAASARNCVSYILRVLLSRLIVKQRRITPVHSIYTVETLREGYSPKLH